MKSEESNSEKGRGKLEVNGHMYCPFTSIHRRWINFFLTSDNFFRLRNLTSLTSLTSEFYKLAKVSSKNYYYDSRTETFSNSGDIDFHFVNPLRNNRELVRIAFLALL